MTAPVPATHPGVWLKSRLVKKYGDVRKASDKIGYSFTGLSKVLNGERPVTYRLACSLQSAFGYSAERLLKMQLNHDLKQGRDDVLRSL